MQISDAVVVLFISAAVNAAVIWGVMRTELRWLRRDIDRANGWIDTEVERRAHARAPNT